METSINSKTQVINKRVDNLIVNNNPTEGNSELIDIRTGSDGSTYSSAGEAVRSVERITSHQNLISGYPFTFNGFISINGEFTANDYWYTTDYILCDDLESVYLDGKLWVENDKYHNIWCYDAIKKPIKPLYKSDGSNLQHYKLNLPENTKFIRIVTHKDKGEVKDFRLYAGIKKSAVFPEGMEHSFCWVNGDIYINTQWDSVNQKFNFKVQSKQCYILSKVDNQYIEQFSFTFIPGSPSIDLTISIPASTAQLYWMLYIFKDEKDKPQLLVERGGNLKFFNQSKFKDNKTHLIGIGYSHRMVSCNPNSDIIFNGVPMGMNGVYNTVSMSSGDLSEGALKIDYTQNTIQMTKKGLLMYPKGYIWILSDTSPRQVSVDLNVPNFSTVAIVYDKNQELLDIVSISDITKKSNNYILLWLLYSNRFYYCTSNPSLEVTINGVLKPLGDWCNINDNTYIPLKYKNYIADCINFNSEKDGMSDIIIPKIIDTMEGRQLSIYYDCLSRFEHAENLYRIDNPKSITRNDQCINYTPSSSDVNFPLTIYRLNRTTADNQESKAITVRVNHKLSNKVTKNVCICGDSLVDNDTLATEVYRLLTEDNDCIINQVGTRGISGGKHEGRGSWTWKAYLENNTVAGRTNAFYDTSINGLNFKKYCEVNGFSGIDYFLIALGTNDVTQGGTLYNTLESVQVFINRAKQFIDALLDSQYGFPNCKIGIGICGIGSDYFNSINASSFIFRKSMNTLNLAYLENFDNGKYHPNVTCFSHGMMTNRKYAFPYSNKPTSDRYSELSRTLTNGIHPSAQGYKAWADGYYNLIRGFLTQDTQ